MALTAVTVVDRVTLQVTFGAASKTDVEDPSNWTLVYDAVATAASFPAPAGEENDDDVGAASCVPIKITATNQVGATVNYAGATLTMHPEYTPACIYNLTFLASTLPVTIAANLVQAAGEGEFPKGFLQILTQAVGEEIQFVSGRPETYLLKDFKPSTDNIVFSETTLGFPANGEIWIGNRLFAYKEKFDGGFKQIALAESWNSKRHPKVLYSRLTTPPFLDSIPAMTIIAAHLLNVPSVDQEFA